MSIKSKLLEKKKNQNLISRSFQVLVLLTFLMGLANCYVILDPSTGSNGLEYLYPRYFIQIPDSYSVKLFWWILVENTKFEFFEQYPSPFTKITGRVVAVSSPTFQEERDQEKSFDIKDNFRLDDIGKLETCL